MLGPDKLGDDVTVPRGQLVNAITIMDRITKDLGVTFINYGHVGDGNIHVNIMYDANDADMKQRVYAAKEAISKAILALGGSISGEHGCGISKDASVQIGSRELDLMHGIRAVFDPKGIMNPGKGY